MRRTKLLLILAPLAPLFAVYQYYFSDIFAVSNSTNWTANGVVLTYNAPMAWVITAYRCHRPR